MLSIFLLMVLLVTPFQCGYLSNTVKAIQEETVATKEPYAPSEEIRKLELMMLRLLNEQRKENGLAPLGYNNIIANIARHHSQEMAEYDFVSHYSPVYGFSLKERVQATFPTFKIMGENVAMGKSIKEIHQNLLKSPLHYENIINPQFALVGIGVFKKTPYLYYITQIFSSSLLKHQIPLKPSYYFEKTPPSRPKVITKRWQQSYSFRSAEEERLVSEGLDYYQQGEYQRAIEKYKEALKVNPYYFYGFYNLGLAYLNSNRLDEAKENFDKALVQKPEDAPTHFYIAWIHFSKGELELAEKKALPVLNKNYDHLPGLITNTHFLLGRIYDQMAKTEEAILHYEEFIQRSKVAKYKDLNNLALAIKRLNRLKERLSRRSKKKP